MESLECMHIDPFRMFVNRWIFLRVEFTHSDVEMEFPKRWKLWMQIILLQQTRYRQGNGNKSTWCCTELDFGQSKIEQRQITHVRWRALLPLFCHIIVVVCRIVHLFFSSFLIFASLAFCALQMKCKDRRRWKMKSTKCRNNEMHWTAQTWLIYGR